MENLVRKAPPLSEDEGNTFSDDTISRRSFLKTGMRATAGALATGGLVLLGACGDEGSKLPKTVAPESDSGVLPPEISAGAESETEEVPLDFDKEGEDFDPEGKQVRLDVREQFSYNSQRDEHDKQGFPVQMEFRYAVMVNGKEAALMSIQAGGNAPYVFCLQEGSAYYIPSQGKPVIATAKHHNLPIIYIKDVEGALRTPVKNFGEELDEFRLNFHHVVIYIPTKLDIESAVKAKVPPFDQE